MTGSLRTRLLVGTVTATVLILAASSLALYALARAGLYAEFDAGLGSQARALTALVERENGKLVMEFDAEQFPEYVRSDHAEYFCYWRGDGEVFYRSPSLGSADLERVAGAAGSPEFHSLTLPDGRPGRLAGVAFSPNQASADSEERRRTAQRRPLIVAVARETAAVDHRLAQLAALLVGVCGAGALATLVVMTGMVAALLRPVERLTAGIAAIKADSLGRRFADVAAPRELQPVVERLDDLLARLAAAFSREKSFTADAAHELRTPLAGLRTTIEVALTRLRDPAQYQQALGECLEMCGQMQALVDNLLSLARLEAGKVTVASDQVDLADLIAACWKPFAARARERRLEIALLVPGALSLTSDREKLRLVLHNLFDNAVSYADADGSVKLAVERSAGTVDLRVANSGCALPASDAGHVFERFWRGDAARSATGVHCGLGLALCEKLIAVLGGTISAQIVDGTFAVAIHLADQPVRTAQPPASLVPAA